MQMMEDLVAAESQALGPQRLEQFRAVEARGRKRRDPDRDDLLRRACCRGGRLRRSRRLGPTGRCDGLDLQGGFLPRKRRRRFGADRRQRGLAACQGRPFQFHFVVEDGGAALGRWRIQAIVVQVDIGVEAVRAAKGRLDATGVGAQHGRFVGRVGVHRFFELGFESLRPAREHGGTTRTFGIAAALPAGAHAPQVQGCDQDHSGGEQYPAQFVHRVWCFLA